MLQNGDDWQDPMHLLAFAEDENEEEEAEEAEEEAAGEGEKATRPGAGWECG